MAQTRPLNQQNAFQVHKDVKSTNIFQPLNNFLSEIYLRQLSY